METMFADLHCFNEIEFLRERDVYLLDYFDQREMVDSLDYIGISFYRVFT